jgi:hypothetical protein
MVMGARDRDAAAIGWHPLKRRRAPRTPGCAFEQGGPRRNGPQHAPLAVRPIAPRQAWDVKRFVPRKTEAV